MTFEVQGVLVDLPTNLGRELEEALEVAGGVEHVGAWDIAVEVVKGLHLGWSDGLGLTLEEQDGRM